MACSCVEGEEARIVPAQICTVASSEAVGSEASFSAVVRPVGWLRVCWARAQRAWEAGSVFEESFERTACCWPVAICARYCRVRAVGRLGGLSVLMS
jgi:hypothetical protein